MLDDIEYDKKLMNSIHKHSLIGASLLFILCIGVIGFASFEISGAVVATGTIVVESNVKEVQHQEGGIVTEIRVKDGDLVHSGDIIAILDDTLISSEIDSILRQLYELYAQKERLLAEQSNSSSLQFRQHHSSEKYKDLIETVYRDQSKLFFARKNSLISQKAQLNDQIAQINEQIIGLKAEKEAKESELKFVERELENTRVLLSKKFVIQSELNRLEREKVQLIGATSSLSAEVAEKRKAISERELQVLQLGESRREEVLQLLQDTRIEIANLERQQMHLYDRLERLTVRAPIAGYVHNLTIHTVDGVILAGDTITSLVPEKDILLVEAKIRPVDIDQISVTQEVRVRLPNFDQRSTPELMAYIETISPDLLQDPLTGEFYYQVRCSISRDELVKLNGKVLVPGMPVEIFAKTDDRTILSYLVKPVIDQISFALREK